MTDATATTMPVAAKAQKISTFRRALWHVNRTDLGWIVKGALTALHYPEVLRRRKLMAELPENDFLASKTKQLDTFGYVDVTDVASRTLAESVAAHAEAKVVRTDELASRQTLGHKRFWVSLLDEDLIDGQFPSDHPFVRFAMQPEILRIISGHLGVLPQLSDVLLTLSRPMSDEKLSYSQLWHLDHDDKRVCKLFIYLTDVRDTADGPFTFIDAKGSASFRNTLKSHLPDAVVTGKIGASSVREMIAPRLSSFIVDTAHCLHMGSRIKSGHARLLYTATFFPPPRIYPEPNPRFKVVGSASAIERAVFAV